MIDAEDDVHKNPMEPIAIIGIGCRFPKAAGPDGLWKLLREGGNAVGDIPKDRFGDVEQLFDPRPAVRGKMMSRFGGFLENVELFDAEFFGIAPLEAERMDPQQRILLEVAWEALEDAGIRPSSLSCSPTGVFIGSWLQDFESLLIGDPTVDDLKSIDLYTTTGSGRYPIAGRLSYFLGLQGPSMVVDTACSSSLVAIHLACQSIRQGESQMAIAGGVNTIFTPYITVAYSQSKIMAPDGNCKFGDAHADGYVRSEGCGIVVLKPLAKAIDDHDPIYAVILGSAVNNDGRTSGFLTTPGQAGQEDVLRKAYLNAGISPGNVQYVEAHGTGTLAGDPVELNALASVLSEGRKNDHPCFVGSIKTNIGHTEGAAGVAGLIKVALSLKNGEIPASLNFNKPNPRIPWDSLPLKIPHERRPWSQLPGCMRTGGVSAFGITGTNAHVVLQEAPKAEATSSGKARASASPEEGKRLFPISAHSSAALKETVQRLSAWLKDETAESRISLNDLCATAALKREQHDFRLAAVVESIDQLHDGLSEFLESRENPSVFYFPNRVGAKPRVAFVFPGQGSQWLGMCRKLLRESPVFRDAMERCAQALKPYTDWSLFGELEADAGSSRLEEIDVVQPTLFSVQVALAALWQSWGVTPDAVVGHSMGEPAAAYVAGILDLDGAARIISNRSRLMKRMSGRGAMAVVELTMEEAQREIAGHEGHLSIAVSNSPRSTVLSGDPFALDRVLSSLERRSVFCRKIKVDVASHSPQMDPLRPELVDILQPLKPGSGNLPIYSTVTGAIHSGDAFNADYWGENLRRPVRFSETIKQMILDKHTVFIEISPHPLLLRAIDETARFSQNEDAPCVTLPSMLRNEDEMGTLLSSVGRLYCLGYPIDWRGIYQEPEQRIKFPSYSWQRERHWAVESTRTRSRRISGRRGDGRPAHVMLTNYIRSSIHTDLHLWETELNTERFPWLADRTVQGHVVFPAAAFIEMAAAAASEGLGGPVELQNLEFREALFLDRKESKLVQVAISKKSEGGFDVRIQSRRTDEGMSRQWREHVRGEVMVRSDRHGAPGHDVEAIRKRCNRLVSGDSHYAVMQNMQIDYGAAFRGIERIGRSNTEAVARIRAPQVLAADADSFQIHPALLDAGLQLLANMANGGSNDSNQSVTWMPVRLASACTLTSLQATDELWAVGITQADATEQSRHFTGDLFLLNREGRILFEACGVVLQKVGFTMGEDVESWLYEMEWKPSPLMIQKGESDGFLPSPGDIERRILAAPTPGALTVDARISKELLPHLESLSIDYISTAFEQLGLRDKMGRSFTPDMLVQALGIKPQHRKLLNHLLGLLREEGLLVSSGNTLLFSRTVRPREIHAAEERLLSQYPQCRIELSIFYRCGRRLADVLTGAVDPLELLFPGGSLEDASMFYGDSVFARAANHQAGLALQAVIERLPAGHTLRILEIGAGSGGLTACLLPLLPPNRTQYVFTDIGTAFIARAREKYHDIGWLDYGILDIEKDPVAQGFDPHHYDIVLAANCLHATRNMRTSLTNVRTLLASGGLMLLVEGTRKRRWIDLIFGLTEGWWLFEDHDRRPLYPLLGEDAWKALVTETGFADAAIFSQVKAALFDQSIVAARAPVFSPPNVKPPIQPPDKGAWLLFADRDGVGEVLAGTLRSRGDECQLVYREPEFGRKATGNYRSDPKDPVHHAEMQRWFDETESSERRAVVYLWPLDEMTDAPQSADDLRDSQEALCGGLLSIAQTMAAREDSCRSRLWIVSCRALPIGGEGALCLAASTLAGLAKVINLEHPELQCRQVDLDDDDARGKAEVLLEEFTSDDGEMQIAYRGGSRQVPRVTRLGERHVAEAVWFALPENESFRLVLEESGKLDGLRIRPTPRPVPGPDEVVIRVRARGVNFRDVLTILGAYPGDGLVLGLEAAGEVIDKGSEVRHLAVGDAVIACGQNAFGTFMTAPAALALRKLPELTFEQAATLPIAFLTAHYGLVHLAGLKAGERVLIHAASGGVGLAAIQIAKNRGAEIFGTAGSPRKRSYLESLGIQHVFDSRSLDFADRIMEMTASEGVDVVLNSLSDEFISKSLSILRPNGRFIEIGRRGILSREQAKKLRPDVYYEAFDLTAVMNTRTDILQPMFEQVMTACAARRLQPLPATIFPIEDAVGAFRYMLEARHIGKIVVNQQPWSGGKPIDAPDAFSDQNTYLITGAFGGIGLGLVRWLFERGARQFALVGRNRPSSEAAARIEEMAQCGANIRTAVCDVASQVQIEALFRETLAVMPPLRGVFHLAGALDDGALIQQSWRRFEKVLAPKVLGAWNLHCQTRQSQLDCFVMFSSWSSFLGSQGQANHSAANSFLDALAWHRRANGLPAVSINWGAWAEVGAASRGDIAEQLHRRGIGSFSPEMGFRALGRLMSQGAAQVAVTPFNLVLWRKSSPAAARSTWFEFLDADTRVGPDDDGDRAVVEAAVSLIETLRATPSEGARRQVMETFLKSKVAETLRMPITRIDADKPFKSYGMDSLTALEFRNRVEAATGTTLSATLVFNYPTIRQLQFFLLEKLKGELDDPSAEAAAAEANEASPADAELQAMLDEVESLSEEEARRMLDDEH